MMLSDVFECVRGRREYKKKGNDKEQTRGGKKRAEREERERGRQAPKSGWPKATSLLVSGTEVVQMIED